MNHVLLGSVRKGRVHAPLVLVISMLVLVNFASAQIRPRLLARDDVGRLGLERAWFAQIDLDRARNHVERAVLHGDVLVVLSTAGLVQALDANTGETLWTAAIGNPDYPSLGPAVSEQHVALVNGSTLYVLDRQDGKVLKTQQVGGAPGATPALSNDYVFVPLINGRIEGYPLDKSVLTPWYYQSFGRTMVPPLATPEILAWPTDRGYAYVASSDDPAVRYRVETGSRFIAPASYAKPTIYAANVAGEVFAVDVTTGRRRWKYATGFPVNRAPAIVENRVYVTNEWPSLVVIDADTGAGLWEAVGVTQFAAASQNRVYGVDDLGALVVLDAESGASLGRLTTDGRTKSLVNDQTDRVYLVSDDGMVQCLHEIGAKEPIRHGEPAQVAPSAESQPTGRPNVATPQPETESEDPFAPDDEPAEEAADEADEPTTLPAVEPFGTDEENPFGF